MKRDTRFVVIFLCFTTSVKGHGRLIEPPSRSSAFRYGFNTPHNDNDHELSCGGFSNLWERNQGRCGVCGDPYQGPRENEAGGKYATGTIVRHYQEGQRINIGLDLTVGHGGWSEFRICPNNDVTRAVTQQCLDQYRLATTNGETRVSHPHRAGYVMIQLKLPQGLVCSQCVLQWKWNTGSNNNCNYVTHENCCDGCGLQEQFYGCADVSIQPVSGNRVTVSPYVTRTASPPARVDHTQPGGFIPINV